MKLQEEFNNRFEREVGAVATLNQSRRLFAFACLLMLCSSGATAQATSNPQRWQAQYTQIYSEDFEGSHPGIQLQNGASVTTDPALVLAGSASIRLNNFAGLVTNPTALPFAGNTTYIFEFKYRIQSYGTADNLLSVAFYPAGTFSQQAAIPTTQLLKNAPAVGTFSAGAMMGQASSWVFAISANAGVDVVIDSVAGFRQDAVQTRLPPPSWSRLATLPYPRLGKRELGPAFFTAADADGSPYLYSLDQIERRLAFFDVITDQSLLSQTEYPDSMRRLRALNPNLVILPLRSAQQVWLLQPPSPGVVDLTYQFWQGMPDAWYLRDSKGNYPRNADYDLSRFANFSTFAPIVDGQTFFGYLLKSLDTTVFSSGLWDGILFDDLTAGVPGHLPNQTPELFDADYNRTASGTRPSPG
jgi:hypothetical protein